MSTCLVYIVYYYQSTITDPLIVIAERDRSIPKIGRWGITFSLLYYLVNALRRENRMRRTGERVAAGSGPTDSGDKVFPVHDCKRKLANDFSAFFYNKVLNIRSELRLTDTHTGGSVTNCFSGVPLNTFMDATEAEIWNIIKLSPVKSCELDPLPTWLLKECKDELVPLITDIVNMSLRKCMIPKSL